MTLTIALSKGKLLAGATDLFRRAGVPFPDEPGRRLVVDHEGLRFLFVKDADVPTYVEYGVADCGIAGRDVLLEAGSDVYEPLDLGFGRCRLVVARPRGARVRSALVGAARRDQVPARGHHATSWSAACPSRWCAWRARWSWRPGLGLSDCIVDVVETGGTLDANGLEAVEDVAASSARFIVNRASYHAHRDDVAALMERLREAVR